MVNSCYIEGIIENGKYRDKQKADVSCMYNENGKLLFEPVSSTETGLIYVNSKCAQCNRVFNYNPWYFYSNDSSIIVRNTITGENNVELRMFTPPRNENLLKNLCSYTDNDRLHNCTETSQWYHSCKNLNSPFQTEISPGLYKNVFCAVCTGIPIHETCSEENAKALNRFGFTVLVDNSVVEMSRKAKMQEECFNNLFSHHQVLYL
jgi:hypothetical protein